MISVPVHFYYKEVTDANILIDSTYMYMYYNYMYACLLTSTPGDLSLSMAKYHMSVRFKWINGRL